MKKNDYVMPFEIVQDKSSDNYGCTSDLSEGLLLKGEGLELIKPFEIVDQSANCENTFKSELMLKSTVPELLNSQMKKDVDLIMPFDIIDNKTVGSSKEGLIRPFSIETKDKSSKKHGIKCKRSILPKSGLISNLGNPEFIVNEKGIFYIDPDSNEAIQITNFVLIPKCIVIEDDGIYQDVYYAFEIAVSGDTFNTKISVEQFRNDLWIKNASRLSACVYNKRSAYKLVQLYIAQFIKHVPIITEYQHVGIRKIDNNHVYLHAGGAIGTKQPIHGHKDYLLETNPMLTKSAAFIWMLDMTNITEKRHISVVCLTFNHLAILKQLFSDAGHEIQSILLLYGKTNSLKTTLSKMFFNIFNRSRDYISASLKDTLAALERKGFEMKDAVLCVDDYHPTSNKAEKSVMDFKVTELIRYYGDNVCKSRMKPNLERQRDYPPRGLCAFTGEDNFNGLSTVSRVFEVEVNPGDVNINKLLEHQKNPLNYSTNAKYFIEWSLGNYNDLVNYIREGFVKKRHQYNEDYKLKRLGETLAVYEIGIEIIFMYAEEIGVMDQYQANECVVEWSNNIRDALIMHEDGLTENDPVTLYLNSVNELLLSGRCYLIDKSKSARTTKKTGRKIGYENDEYIFLIPNITFNEVSKFYNEINQLFPIGFKSLNKALHHANFIEVHYENQAGKKVLKRTMKATFDGTTQNYLQISKAQLNCFLGR